MSVALPGWLSAEDWADFVEHRKDIRKPMTDRAERRMLKQLCALHTAGHDVTALIDRAIRNGWQDVRIYDGEAIRRPSAHRITTLPDYGERTNPETARANVHQLIQKARGG
jgi:hypothetical protein